MQLVDKKNIEKRILFYLSKMYIQNFNQGHDYSKLNKCIAILFTDFNLENLKSIPQYVTKWNIREEKYSQIILTDAIEIYIIELSKVKQYKENALLDEWVNFIINPGDVDMENSNESIKKAKEVLDEISQSEREQYLAHLRMKYIADQKAIEDGAFEKGIKQGSTQSKIQIAKNLKNENVDIEIIMKATGLTKEEIEEL